MSEISEVPINIGQVKKDLLDPRLISKKYDPEGRNTTASSVSQVKTEGRTISGQIEGQAVAAQQLQESQSNFYNQVGKKSSEAEQRERSLLVRLKAKLRIGDNKLQQTQIERDSLISQAYDVGYQARQVNQEIEELKKLQEELPDPKVLLEAYYEKVRNLPLTQQEKRDFLKPEVLEDLTTEEYIALWRRLNPFFLSHVTRQGFRDHNAMFYHSGGMQEFHGGFVSILNDEKKLRTPLAVHGLPRRDTESVKKYLGSFVLEAENTEEAEKRFQLVLHHTLASAPKYPDSTAVHFMAQTVGDRYYGGETGNEVFFIFPSDVIASQHDFAFNGWEKDLTRRQSEDKWNDVFVWPQDLNNPGISVNTGIVFLPENTPVDPETGSKYASRVEIADGKEKRVMIEDEERVKAFIDWAITQDDQSWVRKAIKEYDEERNYQVKDLIGRALIIKIYTEIQGLGFTQDAAAALAHRYIGEFNVFGIRGTTEDTARHIIDKSGAQWKRAENTVSAKQYWESYFAKNPDQQPKHIVFYDGDPHTAIYEFQRKHGIGAADTSEKDGQLLGFEDHFVSDMREDPRANKGYEELVALGTKIINEHYAPKQAVA